MVYDMTGNGLLKHEIQPQKRFFQKSWRRLLRGFISTFFIVCFSCVPLFDLRCAIIPTTDARRYHQVHTPELILEVCKLRL